MVTSCSSISCQAGLPECGMEAQVFECQLLSKGISVPNGTFNSTNILMNYMDWNYNPFNLDFHSTCWPPNNEWQIPSHKLSTNISLADKI